MPAPELAEQLLALLDAVVNVLEVLLHLLQLLSVCHELFVDGDADLRQVSRAAGTARAAAHLLRLRDLLVDPVHRRQRLLLLRRALRQQLVRLLVDI